MKSFVKEGNRIVWTFDDRDRAQPLIDERASLEQLASEVYGTRVEIVIEANGGGEKPNGRRVEDKPSPLRDDPVLQSFQKHLGGELLKEKR